MSVADTKRKLYSEEYYKEKRDRIIERNRKYYLEHREQILIREREKRRREKEITEISMKYDLACYSPRTLCELCEKACGGCSWSMYGVQEPVEGWVAVRRDIRANKRYKVSYIVLDCPEFLCDVRCEHYYKKWKENGRIYGY